MGFSFEMTTVHFKLERRTAKTGSRGYIVVEGHTCDPGARYNANELVGWLEKMGFKVVAFRTYAD
jgi:hypothetical protein